MSTTADYALLSLAAYPRTAANAGPFSSEWIRYAIATDQASDFDAVAFYPGRPPKLPHPWPGQIPPPDRGLSVQ